MSTFQIWRLRETQFYRRRARSILENDKLP